MSDCISNSIRVLKTTRQTSPTTITYREAAQQVNTTASAQQPYRVPLKPALPPLPTMHPRVQTRRSEPRIREQQHQSRRTDCDATTAQVIDKDGVKGLFGRGLGTRLMTNGVQVHLITAQTTADYRET